MDLSTLDSLKGAFWDIVVVTSAYPSQNNTYSGAFVKSKVDFYRGYGKSVVVIRVVEGSSTQSFQDRGADFSGCFTLSSSAIIEVLAGMRFSKIFAHSLTPLTLHQLGASGFLSRAVLWFHGYEVRDPSRLDYNFTGKGMRFTFSSQRKMIAASLGFARRRSQLRTIFEDHSISKVFVSEFLRTIASHDVGTFPCNSYVIPNPIDTNFFRPLGGQSKLNVLFLRPFAAHNYGLDIMQNTVLGYLDRYPGTELQFFICGDGKYHSDFTSRIKGRRNVTIVKKILSRAEIKEMHSKCGTLLYPTRFDTQGVSMCEALSSGMVVIANDVAAISEYARSDYSYLIPSYDEDLIIDALRAVEMMSDAEFWSRAAKARSFIVQNVSAEKIIPQEISLFEC